MRESGKGKFGIHIHYDGGGQEKRWYETASERDRQHRRIIDNMTGLHYAEPIIRNN